MLVRERERRICLIRSLGKEENILCKTLGHLKRQHIFSRQTWRTQKTFSAAWLPLSLWLLNFTSCNSRRSTVMCWCTFQMQGATGSKLISHSSWPSPSSGIWILSTDLYFDVISYLSCFWPVWSHARKHVN